MTVATSRKQNMADTQSWSALDVGGSVYHADLMTERFDVSVGCKVGRWLVTGISTKKRHYLCVLCECGAEREVYKGQLVRGGTKSCGCLARELSSNRQSGKASPMLGRQLSDERKQAISEWSKTAWATGVMESPARKAHIARLVAEQAGTPETGVNAKGTCNHNAKPWRLIAPNGSIFEGVNISHFVRERRDLFSEHDAKFRVNEYGTETASNASVQLCKVNRGERPSWKGWRRAA